MNALDENSKNSETLSRILEAAADVFAEVGFAGARMDQIARHAGVNKATIYYHIGDKMSLYTEVIRRVLGSTAEKIRRNTKDIDSPDAKIRAYINTMAEAMDENPRMPSIMLREIASGGVNLPDAVIADFAGIIGIVGGIVEEGAGKGRFSQNDPLMVHLMVVGTFALFKVSTSIRSRYAADLLETGEKAGEISGVISSRVADMIVKALSV